MKSAYSSVLWCTIQEQNTENAKNASIVKKCR
jgi:hypothetical protein